MEYNSAYTIDKLHEKLPAYTVEELNYHCLQMIDADLLNAKSMNVVGRITPQVWRIFDLTYSGHQFLADIRSDNVWNKTKDVAKNVGSESLHALKDIAVNLVTSTILTLTYIVTVSSAGPSESAECSSLYAFTF